MSSYITPKNWREFQHYKDRNPPWIRLHKALLDNYEWHKLPTASKALAPMLWLMASDAVDGKIDADPEKIAFRLRMNAGEVAEALKHLISLGFFILSGDDASGVLAPCSQVAPKSCPETEALQRTETEAETEAEREKPRKADKRPAAAWTVSSALAEGVDPIHMNDWIKARKSPLTQTAWEGFKVEAEKAGITPAEAVRICAVRGWRGFKADWDWKSAAKPSSGASTGNSATDQRNAEAMRLLGINQGDCIDA